MAHPFEKRRVKIVVQEKEFWVKPLSIGEFMRVQKLEDQLAQGAAFVAAALEYENGHKVFDNTEVVQELEMDVFTELLEAVSKVVNPQKKS